MQKNPFQSTQPWMNQILTQIKKDIKTDHLVNDKVFFKTHFGNRPQHKLTFDEIFPVYEKELLAGNQGLIDWVVNRWVFKFGEVYRHFAERLAQINPNFAEIESLSDAEATKVLDGASERFGATNTYLFARINGVVFSNKIFEQLYQAALNEKQAVDASEREKTQETVEEVSVRYQREIDRLKEKYEDKLAGIQRKYTTDVEALKKQIRSLQAKVNERR